MISTSTSPCPSSTPVASSTRSSRWRSKARPRPEGKTPCGAPHAPTHRTHCGALAVGSAWSRTVCGCGRCGRAGRSWCVCARAHAWAFACIVFLCWGEGDFECWGTPRSISLLPAAGMLQITLLFLVIYAAGTAFYMRNAFLVMHRANSLHPVQPPSPHRHSPPTSPCSRARSHWSAARDATPAQPVSPVGTDRRALVPPALPYERCPCSPLCTACAAFIRPLRPRPLRCGADPEWVAAELHPLRDAIGCVGAVPPVERPGVPTRPVWVAGAPSCIPRDSVPHAALPPSSCADGAAAHEWSPLPVLLPVPSHDPLPALCAQRRGRMPRPDPSHPFDRSLCA